MKNCIKLFLLPIFLTGLSSSTLQASYQEGNVEKINRHSTYHPLTLVKLDLEMVCKLSRENKLAKPLFIEEPSIVLKLADRYSYIGIYPEDNGVVPKGAALFLDNKLYESINISFNYDTQILFIVGDDVARDYPDWIEKAFGLKTCGINILGTNTLKEEYFPNPDQNQSLTVIGQTLRLCGSFGEIQQKAVTLDNLRVKELSIFQGILFTPPKNDCHGGAIVLLPSTGNIDPGLISHAQWLVSHGFCTFIIDTFYGNNISGGLKNPLESPMQNEVITAFRARQVLSSHPYVNNRKIGIGGFSRGGTVADLVSRREFYELHSHDGQPFAFEYGYYPSIVLQQLNLAVSSGPKIYFTGDQDPFVDVINTQIYIERLRNAGIDAELKVYKDAAHAFDSSEYWEDKEFPIISNDKINLCYDKEGFVPVDPITDIKITDIDGKQPWDNLPEYLGANIKFGYEQIPNANATKQAEEDLLYFLSHKVG